MEAPRVRLGELLVRAGLISAEQLEEALVEQRRVGKRLGSVLVETGLVSETQVTQILSQQLSVPWVSLHHIDFSRQLLNLVPTDIVERFCLVPIYVRRVRGLGDALYVAMDDPTNAQALQEVAERSSLHVRAMIAPPSDIRAAIRTYYGVGEAAAAPLPPPALPPPPVPVPRDEDEEADVPTGIHSRIALSTPKASPPPAPEGAEAEKLDAAVDALLFGGGPPISEARVRPAAPAPARTAASAAAAPASTRGGAEREESPPSSRSTRDFNPTKPAGERAQIAPSRPGVRMVALTLLDGTTIQVPAKGKLAIQPEPAEPRAEAPEASTGDEGQLTARDIVAALRAASHGADASDILGENVRWEAMFSALLSLLLKKKLITDREFVEEFKKVVS